MPFLIRHKLNCLLHWDIIHQFIYQHVVESPSEDSKMKHNPFYAFFF